MCLTWAVYLRVNEFQTAYSQPHYTGKFALRMYCPRCGKLWHKIIRFFCFVGCDTRFFWWPCCSNAPGFLAVGKAIGFISRSCFIWVSSRLLVVLNPPTTVIFRFNSVSTFSRSLYYRTYHILFCSCRSLETCPLQHWFHTKQLLQRASYTRKWSLLGLHHDVTRYFYFDRQSFSHCAFPYLIGCYFISYGVHHPIAKFEIQQFGLERK